MTWTYTNDPANVDRDALRLTTGDVDPNNPQFTDEEMDWYLSSQGSVSLAAAAAVRALIARYSRMVDQAVGDLKYSYSQRVTGYKEVLNHITTGMNTSSIGIVATGISRSEKETLINDSDAIQHPFSIGQFDNPSAGSDTD